MDKLEIETGPQPQAAVIWLHGLGADGHDFEPIVPQLELAQPVRFVFPHAPVRPVTINQGMRMRAWYDIFQFGGGPEDDAGIRASQKLVEEFIAAEKGKKIVLAGFSQGGAIALHIAGHAVSMPVMIGILMLLGIVATKTGYPADMLDLGMDVELQEADGQALPFEDETFDTVVAGLCMCTFPDPLKAVGEINRVLKPGGSLVALDHVRSPVMAVRLVQKAFNPLSVRIEGDHITREPLEYYAHHGLKILELERSRWGIVERVHALKPGN